MLCCHLMLLLPSAKCPLFREDSVGARLLHFRKMPGSDEEESGHEYLRRTTGRTRAPRRACPSVPGKAWVLKLCGPNLTSSQHPAPLRPPHRSFLAFLSSANERSRHPSQRVGKAVNKGPAPCPVCCGPYYYLLSSCPAMFNYNQVTKKTSGIKACLLS